MTYKVGTIVRLNSGGPPMTVIGHFQSDIIVEWFDGGTRYEHLFPIPCVNASYDDNPPGTPGYIDVFSGDAAASDGSAPRSVPPAAVTPASSAEPPREP
jgi:uncharacterized protein YodC (DUF2158 family)